MIWVQALSSADREIMQEATAGSVKERRPCLLVRQALPLFNDQKCGNACSLKQLQKVLANAGVHSRATEQISTQVIERR
jgi:hypothetical protein